MLPSCGRLLMLLATAVPRWVALLETPSRLLTPLLRHAPETGPLAKLQVNLSPKSLTLSPKP
jgi:hypothetical protein